MNIMERVVSRIDKSNMRQVILDFPKQFQLGIKSAKEITFPKFKLTNRFENIIICGMGGSGLPAEILATLQPLNVFPHKNYKLPLQAGNKSLIICISYSGNTEETISSYQEAVNRRLPVISISTGGKLEELSKKHNTPLVKIPPPYIPPRLALGLQFAALLQVLANLNLISHKIIEELLEMGRNLKPEKFENQGKKLAEKFFKKIPIIYTSKRFREIGLIWKNNLNETAKIFAVANYLPELNHNEIVGFWKINEKQIENKKLYVIILRDLQESHPRILRQMEITKYLIEREGIKVEFVDIQGRSMLEKIFSSIILGFWTSYWLALKYKIDPTPVKMIDEFKQRLKMEI